ncbi:MAG: dihydrolipoyl dehydrogenase family protein [Nannocystales bacterium]
MATPYDIIIIGGGNAGFAVSKIAHAEGKRLAFIEERDFGGTCPNRGCTPKKVLVAAAHVLDEIARASVHAIEVEKPKLDWPQLIARAQDMISFIPDAMASTAGKRADVYRGRARFVDPHTVEVGGVELRGEHIVIATGSRPRPLAFEGAEHLVTSEVVLSDPELPDEVLFVGGGVIAMEFAHVLQRAGSEVTILEVMPRLLSRLDEDAVAALRTETESLGTQIHTGIQVVRIEPENGRLRVHYTLAGEAQSKLVDRVVNGAGRVANVDGLNLEAAAVEHDRGRITVDAYLRSKSQPHIWVAGDALANSAQLSPLAGYEGSIVGHNIVHGPEKTPDYRTVPSVVHTVPALASVGLSEAQAIEAGKNVRVTKNDMATWFSGRSYAETTAFAKVLIDKETDLILGAQMVGHRGEELIHVFALAMAHGITASNLAASHFAFPTFSSDIKNLL